MQKNAQVADAAEPLYHSGIPRVVEIEEQVAVGWESVGEERFASAEFMLRVVGQSPFSPTGVVATIVP
jgi:hypothetical protein